MTFGCRGFACPFRREAALIAAAAFAGPTLAQPAEPPASVEADCSAIERSGGERVTRPVPGLRIIEATAREGPLVLDVQAGASIVCPRSSILPAPNDWKVLAAGHVLYILEMDVPSSERRVGVLDAPGGHLHYRLVQGRFSPAEAEQLGARLDQLQQSVDR